MRSAKKIYFLHINKTAGSSFNKIAELSFHIKERCPAGLIPELLVLPNEKIRTYNYYHGHFGLGLPTLLEKEQIKNLDIITLLRNPIDRMISQINAHIRNPGTTLHERIKRLEGDVEACLEEPGIKQFLSNYQARVLGINLDLNKLKTKGGPYNGLQELVALAAKYIQPEDILKTAKNTLEQCSVIGITENFPKSVSSLSNWLGINYQGEVPFINKSSENPHTGKSNAMSRQDLSPKVIRKLEDLNRLDFSIYEYALTLNSLADS